MSLRPLVELKGLNFNPHVLIETISYREDGKARNIAQLMITVRPNGQMQYGTNAVYYCVFYMYAPLDSIYWSSLLCLISKIQISRVNFIYYVVKFAIIAVCYDNVALFFELFNVVYNLTSKESFAVC